MGDLSWLTFGHLLLIAEPTTTGHQSILRSLVEVPVFIVSIFKLLLTSLFIQTALRLIV